MNGGSFGGSVKGAAAAAANDIQGDQGRHSKYYFMNDMEEPWTQSGDATRTFPSGGTIYSYHISIAGGARAGWVNLLNNRKNIRKERGWLLECKCVVGSGQPTFGFGSAFSPNWVVDLASQLGPHQAALRSTGTDWVLSSKDGVTFSSTGNLATVVTGVQVVGIKITTTQIEAFIDGVSIGTKTNNLPNASMEPVAGLRHSSGGPILQIETLGISYDTA